MERHISVALTAALHNDLVDVLVRPDGQEDVCLALYRRSTGATRLSALLWRVIKPEAGERRVHGNATIHASLIQRGARLAAEADCGLALLHSHPLGSGWQGMSPPDWDAEHAYANLVRETTGLPLLGMTLAGCDQAWSARLWNEGVGRGVRPTHATNVRVIGETLEVSWNDGIRPPPRSDDRQLRTVSAWGSARQADLARRSVLVVGLGSVGLDIAVRLAASGIERLSFMDDDIVKPHNLDRMIGATRDDAEAGVSKVVVAQREALRNATASAPDFRIFDADICSEEGLSVALDHDLIFSCVDRPWPRAVLNNLAYADLIPVIDGGIAIDTRSDGTMRGATWRAHVVRPGVPCMYCNRQINVTDVSLQIQGLLDDAEYLKGTGGKAPKSQNVAPLSISVSAALLAQYVSLSVGPGGLGHPAPLQYVLGAHTLQHLDWSSRPACNVEDSVALGDRRISL